MPRLRSEQDAVIGLKHGTLEQALHSNHQCVTILPICQPGARMRSIAQCCWMSRAQSQCVLVCIECRAHVTAMGNTQIDVWIGPHGGQSNGTLIAALRTTSSFVVQLLPLCVAEVEVS